MHRRREWERAVAAEARATQAQPAQGWRHWPELSRRFLAVMRTFAKPQFSRTAASTTAVQEMAPVERLQSGGALVQKLRVEELAQSFVAKRFGQVIRATA